jgi:hypothetical protein
LTAGPLHRAAEGRDLLDPGAPASIEAPSVIAPGIPPELEIIVMRALIAQSRGSLPDRSRVCSRDHARAPGKQVLVDSDVVGAVISRFVSREQHEPESARDPESTGRAPAAR